MPAGHAAFRKFADLLPPRFRAPELVAELGTSHAGDLGRARQLIAAAADAGADTIKFQWVIASEILHPRTGRVPLPGGSRELYDVFRDLERPGIFYSELKQICDERGVEFLCSPFGTESAEELRRLGVRRMKVASPELNHLPLLRQIASFDLEIILSTGISKLADIEEALEVFADKAKITLLHCITSYPAPEEEYNLLLLPLYGRLFGVATGVSDHSLDPELIPCLAALCGAVQVEKHVTLSREGDGLDDPIAIDPRQLESLRRKLDSLDGLPTEDAWARLAAEFGEARLVACLGTGKKVLAPSEAANYGRTNRSIHALRALPAGHVLKPGDVAVLRTEKELSVGLHPRYLDAVISRRLARDIEDGAGLSWDHILG